MVVRLPIVDPIFQIRDGCKFFNEIQRGKCRDGECEGAGEECESNTAYKCRFDCWINCKRKTIPECGSEPGINDSLKLVLSLVFIVDCYKTVLLLPL